MPQTAKRLHYIVEIRASVHHTLEGAGTMVVEVDSTISLHELNRIKQQAFKNTTYLLEVLDHMDFLEGIFSNTRS